MKNYILRYKSGKQMGLSARNNREAMKLSGVLYKYLGDLLSVEDEQGNIIIQNV